MKTRSSAPTKQKGLSREAVHPTGPFLTAAALNCLHDPSPTHDAVRSSAELALSSEILSNCMTCIFLAILALISCLTVINTVHKQLHSGLQQNNVLEVYYLVRQSSQPQQSKFI